MNDGFKQQLNVIAEQATPENAFERIDAALDAHMRISSTPRTALIALLRDTAMHAAVRKTVAYRLGHMGDKRAEPALTAIASAPSEPSLLRAEAARSLALLGNRRAVRPLIAVLQHDLSAEARTFAAYALGMIGDERAVEPLLNALADEDDRVRDHAAEALGYLRDRRAVEPLIGRLSDASPDVRYSAAFALSAVGDEQALPALAQVAATEQATMTRFGSVGEQAADAIRAIKEREACGVEGKSAT